jgi:murein DD-endopeptidase MepM/ murein hydrolase activator NlpD
MKGGHEKLEKKRYLIPLVLLVVLVFQWWKIIDLKKDLSEITIISWSSDSLYVGNGLNFNQSGTLFTSEFIDRVFQPSSPFNDGLSFAELKKKYLKYGSPDLYGSPRRTGNIRRIHEGIDLTVPENTPVYPVFPYGIVTIVSDNPEHMESTQGIENGRTVESIHVSYGKVVKILYPEGIESLYAHLNEVKVVVGQVVYADTQVGLTGYTGNIKDSGKPSHLHLELRDSSGKSFDPDSRLHYNMVSMKLFLAKYAELNKKEK